MTDLCAECTRAESEYWPVYTVTLWCCRARHIVDATTSKSGGLPPTTLAEVRRNLSKRERERYPADWVRVRARLVWLIAAQDAREGTVRATQVGIGSTDKDDTVASRENRGQIKC